MIVDLRLSRKTVARAREHALSACSAVIGAAGESGLDPEQVRVVCDWVQYKHNFRQPVDRRAVLDGPEGGCELAVDLRQVAAGCLDETLSRALDPAGEEATRAYLESWTALDRSCIWRFNSLYWQELALWEKMLGQTYEEALPGGQSGGTQVDATRELIRDLFRIWDGLAARHALPEQLTVLELGVGSGDQAKLWLDEFVLEERERGTDYYRRLQYLMADYSTHVLDRARANVAAHRERVSTLVLDAARPRDTLRFLEGQIFFIYISNVYDNLPTEEIVSLNDTLYRVEARAYLPAPAVAGLAAELDVSAEQVAPMVGRFLRLGSELLAESAVERFPDTGAAVEFCREVWAALRLEERYVRLGALDLYEICEGVSGEVLGPVLDGHGYLRMHVSNGAAGSLLDTLPLLHPFGLLVCHDLFVTDLAEYRSGFRGPGKYDGSVVNWVNGPVLAAIAARRGYQVTFRPFGHGSKSPVLTMTARARE